MEGNQIEDLLHNCEICRRSKVDVPLIKFPFILQYKELEIDMNSAIKNHKICLDCLKEEVICSTLSVKSIDEWSFNNFIDKEQNEKPSM